MDQTTGHSRRDIEEGRAVMTEKMGIVEEQVQATVEGVKTTVDSALERFKQAEETIEAAKSAVDSVLDSLKVTVHEMVERVKPTADLLDQVGQNPWLLIGSVILMGYILGSRGDGKASARESAG